ncbi:MAG: glycosyltransferase [Phycisphaerales bacterium]
MPSTPPPITALLPVGPAFDAAALARAVASLAAQMLRPAELLVVANGLDGTGQDRLDDALAAAADTMPTRVLRRERPGLAAALNTGLREASTELVARMDADDLCEVDRLLVQAAALHAAPDLAGLGCSWRAVDWRDEERAAMRPPTDPRRLRWMLRTGNCLAHGSMMLRRSRVLDAGGYDESLPRAQDYDLWLRLTREAPALGAVADVLYMYREQQDQGVAASSAAQARAAAAAMVASWNDLPLATDPHRQTLETTVADAMLAENGGLVTSALERQLDQHPTREALIAWLWARDRFPPMPRRAIEIARRSRLREIGCIMLRRGLDEVWLWGAGQHGQWVLDHMGDLGLSIAGFVDDHAAGQTRRGRTVLSPDTLNPGDHALLCSDWHEETMWEQSATARARGVNVWRLYAESDPRS